MVYRYWSCVDACAHRLHPPLSFHAWAASCISFGIPVFLVLRFCKYSGYVRSPEELRDFFYFIIFFKCPVKHSVSFCLYTDFPSDKLITSLSSGALESLELNHPRGAHLLFLNPHRYTSQETGASIGWKLRGRKGGGVFLVLLITVTYTSRLVGKISYNSSFYYKFWRIFLTEKIDVSSRSCRKLNAKSS